MKKPTIIPLFASLLFASFVSVTAQETAGVAPIKASVKESTTTPARPLSEIYRVGVGDVLDIRLLNSASNKSTLFTVVESGVID
jgi:protein involved in polysaccharide export with SLBB domain